MRNKSLVRRWLRPAKFFLALTMIAFCLPVMADLRAVLVVDDDTKALVSINTSTGVATTLGTFAMADFNVGGSVVPNSGEIHFMGNAVGDSTRSLYKISNSNPGNAVVLPLSFPAGWDDIPFSLTTNGTSTYGIFQVSDTEKGLGIINSSNGNITNLGVMAASYLPSGVAGQQTNSGLVYYTGQAVGETDWRIFGVSTSGSIIRNAVISAPSQRDQRPLFLEVHSNGTIYAILRSTNQNLGFLFSINGTTGVATQIGSGFGILDTGVGVSTLDESAGIFFFTGYTSGDAGFRLQGINLSTGARASLPVITSANGYLTRPVLLAVSAAGTGAGTVPTTLIVEKNGNDLDMSWSGTCGDEALDYTIQRGIIGSFYGHSLLACTTVGATAKTITPSGGSYYYLIVPVSGTEEGGYGADSLGSARPRSTSTCKTNQETSPCS